MTADSERFRQALTSGVEQEIASHADAVARTVVATVWNAVDDQCAALTQQVADAERARNFAQRSVDHIAAKRDLAEAVLGEWEGGRLPADRALRMIRAALAVGNVKTIDQLWEVSR